MLGNYLFINKYWQQLQELWRQILRTIFESYTTIYSESTNKKFIVFEPRVYKIESFDYFILYLIIEFTPNKDLEELLLKFKIEDLKLKNGDEDVNTLIVYFKNYIDEISDIRLDGKDNISNDKILNFLTIFRLIDINKEAAFKDIVYAYIKFVEFYVLYSKNNQNIYMGFLYFVYVVTNNFKDKKNNIDLKIYEYIILHIYNSIKKSFIYYYKELIIYCFRILKEENDYELKNQKIIDFYLDKVKENKMECLDEILIEIYSLADKSHKEKIDKFFEQDKYKKITEDNWLSICCAIENGIIEFSKDFEDQLFESIEDLIQKRLDNKNDIESSNEPLVKLMNCLLRLFEKNKIENKNRVNELLVKVSDVKYFMNNHQVLETLQRLIAIHIDPENYDYSKVRFDDFRYLDLDIIKKIKSNANNVKNIAGLLLENSNLKENNYQLYKIFKCIFDNKE